MADLQTSVYLEVTQPQIKLPKLAESRELGPASGEAACQGVQVRQCGDGTKRLLQDFPSIYVKIKLA